MSHNHAWIANSVYQKIQIFFSRARMCVCVACPIDVVQNTVPFTVSGVLRISVPIVCNSKIVDHLKWKAVEIHDKSNGLLTRGQHRAMRVYTYTTRRRYVYVCMNINHYHHQTVIECVICTFWHWYPHYGLPFSRSCSQLGQMTWCGTHTHKMIDLRTDKFRFS